MAEVRSRYAIIGTAGHVDHGKTTLIKALTGHETDKTPEEKARGISINLGFAPFKLPDGTMAGVVDVPGHERFIHNMLAGIGGIDLVLLVVDVNEGVMPQTIEHLQILQLLSIKRGIIVLTKCDLADPEWVDIVEEEVRESVQGSFLGETLCCRVSATTGEGIAELKQTILNQLAAIPEKSSSGPVRLPVDRHFSVSGFGTVVTGTLLSGSLQAGERLELLPQRQVARVREMQVHGVRCDTARAGQRVAVNLGGVSRDDVPRGAVLATPGIFDETERLDVRLRLLPAERRKLKFRDQVHLFLGTAYAVARVILLDRDEMPAGEELLLQLYLDRPLVAHPGDRFVIRSYSPMTTIGGGVVIDARPVKHRRFRPSVMEGLRELEGGDLGFLLQKLGSMSAPNLKGLEKITGWGRDRIEAGLTRLIQSGKVRNHADRYLAGAQEKIWREELLRRTESFHEQEPLLPGIPGATLRAALPQDLPPKVFDYLVAGLVDRGLLAADGNSFRQPGFAPQLNQEQHQAAARILGAFAEAGLEAKNLNEMLARTGVGEGVAAQVLPLLIARGELVRLNEESLIEAKAYQQAEALLVAIFTEQQTMTLAEYRDRSGSARKMVQALLEYFDSRKFTLRRDDHRVAWQLPVPEMDKEGE